MGLGIQETKDLSHNVLGETMTQPHLKYTMGTRTFRVSIVELSSILGSTNECLDATFNMQVQTLVELLEEFRRDIVLDELTDDDLKSFEEDFPGINKKTIEAAVKSYHQYATNMFSI